MSKIFEGTKKFQKDKSWHWVLIGLPLDITETFRPGTAGGPDAIRLASESIESYSPFLDIDISEFMVADYGNLGFAGLDAESSVKHIYEKVKEMDDLRLGFLGGEHTVTLGILKALSEKYKNLHVVILDAHTDMRDEYEGQKINHATWLKRALEFIPVENVVLLGARSGTREEFKMGLREIREDVEVDDSTMDALTKAEAVYLSVDIDALDAPYVPGCGNPEPGGLHYKEAEELVHWLGTSTNLVGFDLVEVAPNYDISQITAITAARLVREIIAASLVRIAKI